jgi:FMN-dependent NADH-azoreductase
MRNILYISSSPRRSESYSKQVAQNVIGDLRERDPHARDE